ncbi:hypothetical protein QBC32DRAFT_317453 [Pseudoneurospora amorphoporcata]|uniref:Uncharacterized protein n=1 Tax=Pseudoneurospora amorphoporcata TaxID=241081 RepID=A0AAN6NMV7_9PEZI|nr:hypothetical protein QBC32DRAFT_317453 [Pseudoneurospora amorphoporcata]
MEKKRGKGAKEAANISSFEEGEELKGNRCLQFLKKSPGHDDAKDWEKYLQTLRPQPVREAVEAVKKEETRQRSKKPQSDTTGSTSARTNRAQQPGSTSALYGGQAAPPS